ncbi:MAG: hypothetical protein ABFS38_06345 [Bacteroidota bacterium]
MCSTDITILTDSRYVAPGKRDPYIRNILYEEELVKSAFEKRGLKVQRTNWDNPEVDWSDTRYILFRSTWDYVDRFAEFSGWLERVKNLTSMINPYQIIKWNLDKHYLEELSTLGINIPPTRYLEKGDHTSLQEMISESGWKEIILKPVVSCGARHTYKFLPQNVGKYEQIYRSLIREESLMIQEFQNQVPTKGEVAFMLFEGRFSHAILKKAKRGDFRVQDDFGGSVHHYEPSSEEVLFAEKVISNCKILPIYARVDAFWDNHNRLAISELELIEPELWFRFHPEAADRLAEAFIRYSD